MDIFKNYCHYVEVEEHSPYWHELRSKGIGGSDAAALIGKNKYKTNIELWEEKTGITAPADLSNNEAVIFGSKAEAPMREIYALKNRVEVVKPEGTFISNDFPFMRVNVDGIIVKDNGLWEGKTATLRKYSMLKEWDKKLPEQYYVQCIHALAVTGADYIILSALLYLEFSESTVAEFREYRINRIDVMTDIKYLIDQEVIFWNQVETKDEPYLKIKY